MDQDRVQEVKEAGSAILDLAGERGWPDALVAAVCEAMLEFLIERMEGDSEIFRRRN